MPIQVAQKQAVAGSNVGFSFKKTLAKYNAKPVTADDRRFFTEQLSMLLETGTSLHQALGALAKQIESPAMALIINTIAEDIGQGVSFSAALGKHPKLFSVTFTSLVAAGEQGGFLHEVLTELVKMDERSEELKRSVKSALSYPTFLILFSIAVVLFILVAVFPKFSVMFARIEDQLPSTTIILMAASDFLLKYSLEACIGVGVLIAGVGYWFSQPAGIRWLDSMKMSVFGVRDIFVQVYLIQAFRVLGLSISHGVPVVDALVSCRDVVRNHVFRKLILDIETSVKEGGGFAAAFQRTGFLPPIVKQMVTTGEDSGNLALVLARISDHYETELAKKLASFSRMIEPIMLVVMGGMVGLLVSAMILPIFKLSTAVG